MEDGRWMNRCSSGPGRGGGSCRAGGRSVPSGAQGPRFCGRRRAPQGGPQAAPWPRLASVLTGVRVLEQNPHPTLPGALQMNGTQLGTASTKLSPWDKSSQSAHRVDLSPV